LIGLTTTRRPIESESGTMRAVRFPLALALAGALAAAVAGQDNPQPGTATLRVRVPADAVLTIDGNPTPQTGPLRSFVSDVIRPAAQYQYELRATWSDGGQRRTARKTVTIRPGGSYDVDLTTPDGGQPHVALKPPDPDRPLSPDEQAILKNAEGF